MAVKYRFQALQVTSANRTSITPRSGEFLFETDTTFLYIGDGTTAGGNIVSTGGGSVVSSVNGATGVVTLTTSDIPRTAAGGISALTTEGALLEIFDSPTLRTYILSSGGTNLPANGTEQMSWGNNGANDGVVMAKAGEITHHSLQANPVGSAGSASGTLVINGINQTAVGQQVILDNNIGSGGETVSRARGFIALGTAIPFSAGDLIHYRVITSGWAPTSTDVSALIYFRDT